MGGKNFFERFLFFNLQNIIFSDDFGFALDVLISLNWLIIEISSWKPWNSEKIEFVKSIVDRLIKNDPRSINYTINSVLIITHSLQVNPCVSLTLEMFRTGGLITGTLQLLLIAVHHYVSIVRPHSNKKLLRKFGESIWCFYYIISFLFSILFVLFGFLS